MDLIIFITVFSALALLYVVLGLFASKQVKTDADYFVAGRSLGVWQISANLIATQLGGGMLLGTAAQAYQTGFYGILYSLGMGLGFLLLACGIAARLQQFPVTTTAQLFETQYGSFRLKQIASLLSIITLFGILVAQVVGFKSLLYSLGINYEWAIACFWLSIVFYTMIGGLRAITINDMVQLCIIIASFGTLFIYTFFNDPISWFSASSLATIQQLFKAPNISLASLSGLILMPALFALIEQDLAQRFFASRSARVATVSALTASIFLLVFSFIPVYFGIKMRLSGISLIAQQNPLIVFLEQNTSNLFCAIIMCAIVAAIISTADAQLNGIAANITQDFTKNSNIAPSKLLSTSKTVTLIIGIAALFASYIVPASILDIIISSYELSVCCLLVPLLVCYFSKKVYTTAAYCAVFAGLIGFIYFKINPLPGLQEIITLGISGIGYIIGNFYKNKE